MAVVLLTDRPSPTVPPALRARLASSQFTIRALAPLVADAAATLREVEAIAAGAMPAQPMPAEADAVWAAVVGESGAGDLRAALQSLIDLVAESQMTGESPA